MKRIALALTLLLAATVVNAQIYQWKDENGKTVISDKPPIGKVSQQRKIESEAPATTTATSKTAADRELEFRKRQKEAKEGAEKSSKEQSAISDQKENCASARQHLQALESGERIAMRDEKGERYFMEDAPRQQEIVKTRKTIESSCKQ